MSFSPREVYSRCLVGDRGYPLWSPQLKTELCEGYQLEGLKIGDVGIVSPNDGSFDVLFNITLPRNQQPYPKLIREDFTPVVLDPEADIATQHDAVSSHGVISSASVIFVSREVRIGEQNPPKADYEFNLSMKDGAVLILPEGAESCDLANEKTFLGEAIRHGVDWYACVTEDAGRLIHNDSLYLITGFHKAHSWSLGAAGRSDSESGLQLENRRSVKFKVDQIYQDTLKARAYLWGATHAFEGRVGPLYPYEIPSYISDPRLRRGINQTVFIRGFRITVNKLLFLKTVSVETRHGTFGGVGTLISNHLWGGPSWPTQSSAMDFTDNEVDQDFSVNKARLHADTNIMVDRVPGVSQTFHPGDLINQYMLKKEPRGIVALTHDSLWIEMLQLGLLELVDFSNAKRLYEVLSNNYQIILESNAIYLQRNTPHGYPESTKPSDSSTGSMKSPGSHLHQVNDNAPSAVKAQQHLSQYSHQTAGAGSSTARMVGSDSSQDCHYTCHWLVGTVTVASTCNERFLTIDDLMVHLRNVHNVQGAAARKLECRWEVAKGCCGKIIRRDAFRRHTVTHFDHSIHCEECGKSFSRVDALRAHIKKQHGR